MTKYYEDDTTLMKKVRGGTTDDELQASEQDGMFEETKAFEKAK